MHWVIQSNLYHENGIEQLIELVKRTNTPHSLVKVIPFGGGIEPDIDPEGPVVCLGSYGMRHIAKAKGWTPGVWDMEEWDMNVCNGRWGSDMLNYRTVFTTFDDLPNHFHNNTHMFIRPVTDSKVFAGMVIDYTAMSEWHRQVCQLKEDDGSTLTGDTEVMISEVQDIFAEYRLWVVNSEIVTWSLYKRGGKVFYSNDVPDYITDAAKDFLTIYTPSIGTFVMDVCETVEGRVKIVELNTLNAAGLYAANVGKLFDAINNSVTV